ncbi:MAG: histone deacetylase, partial [Desulfitobacteriaceae bacterium]
GKWVFIPHSVYYDTDGFQEIRHDNIRQCNYCGGTVYIESQLSQRKIKHALIRIPFGACPTCVQAGFDLWESQMGRMGSILLQDQVQNKIQFWQIDEGVTTF